MASLKQRLYQEGGWDSILSSRDLVLSPEQKAVAQTVDMAIAQRAAVFLGNGVSLLVCSYSQYAVFHLYFLCVFLLSLSALPDIDFEIIIKIVF